MSSHILNKHLNYESVLNKNSNKLQSAVWFVILLFFTAIIFIADYFAGKYIIIFSLYIIPISLATIKIGFKSGVIFSIIASIAGFITELILKTDASFLLLFTTSLTRLSVLLLLVYGYWKIKSLMHNLVVTSEEDFLTGVSNRRGFFRQGEIELERMARAHQPISLIYIDLDNFKKINDLNGHAVGDKVLQMVATIIKSNIRKVDFLARLGGDEFALILPSTAGSGAINIGEKIFNSIQQNCGLNNYSVGLSIGIASFITPPSSLDYALKCADKLMYEIKKANKNGIVHREF